MIGSETQPKPRLIHTGQVIVDLVMQIDALPAPGGDVLAEDARFEVGGGFNVMAAARRSDMAVVYPGGHGQGRFGAMARQALSAEGIDIAGPEIADQDTGLCVALVDTNAERTFITRMGAESALERTVLDALSVSQGDVVYVSGYSLLLPGKAAVLIDWLEQLPARTTIAFDPGPLVGGINRTLLERIQAVASIWTSNRPEALRFASTQDFSAALDAIVSGLRPGATAIVRDGSRGCHLCTDAQREHIPGFPVTAIDSNGAGDAHAGVFLAEFARGTGIRTAARRANAAAAIAVTRRGPATAPFADEIDEFIARRDV